ncbi:MAG: anaerobic ribonucleoside triphosphate reductase [Clostridiales Family XIII bacterium]|jgi:ribonucleoside-triphosphate reductase|nr:anaerobic ribonucleoside triphosphate reductase [Clostridiales Family XIII bacterium]
MFNRVEKRDGRKVDYDVRKIEKAIAKALKAAGRKDEKLPKELAKAVEVVLYANFSDTIVPTIEDIQNVVEDVLIEKGYAFVARKYIVYRAERTRERARRQGLMKVYEELTKEEAINSDTKRENANIDGDTAMGTMLKIGSEGSKEYYKNFIIKDSQRKAHEAGDIHIHDFDFYTLTTTCCQIDILKLFKGGFSTGHGYLREPNSIQSYAALACIAIQSNQNDQHGGQSIPNFDFGLAPGVRKTYKKLYTSNLIKGLKLLLSGTKIETEKIKQIIGDIEKEKNLFPEMNMKIEYTKEERERLVRLYDDSEKIGNAQIFAINEAAVEIDRDTAQAMEALVHNLNTMHSRAGAQTPFSSINYGTDTSPEGRLIIKNILLATDAGLGNGETAIFPIHVFKVKEGVNYNESDPNYDLFKLAMRVSAKRLFPNFGFLDAPFNLQYYKEGHPETEAVYMGCRTRVIANTYDHENEIVYGRGNLSFTSINLPRIGIKAKGDIHWFFEELEAKMDVVSKQLLDRFQIQSHKKVRNFPFLMGQGVWLDSDKLDMDDTVGEVLKHGTLSIGFIGLAETLKALTGKHHGEDKNARILGLEIISFMRDYCDKKSKETGLNFSLLATPAEGLSGRFVRLDLMKFGKIEGVTDREYYTNSFHVPVYYDITASKKIKIEAPYHELTNAGHISYVELDGDPLKNLDAFEAIIRAMKEAGVGYGSINHPVDRDPVCGYTGIIDNECPNCRRIIDFNDDNVERIRRITGYLVGTTDKFNNAKRAEEKDRVKHNVDIKVEQKKKESIDNEIKRGRLESNHTFANKPTAENKIEKNEESFAHSKQMTLF